MVEKKKKKVKRKTKPRPNQVISQKERPSTGHLPAKSNPPPTELLITNKRFTL